MRLQSSASGSNRGVATSRLAPSHGSTVGDQRLTVRRLGNSLSANIDETLYS